MHRQSKEKELLFRMADKSVTAESMERFRRNAGKAQVADLMGKVTGANTDLISYDAVASRLRAR